METGGSTKNLPFSPLTFPGKNRMIRGRCEERESTLKARPKRAAEGEKRRRSAEEHGPGACGGKHVQPPPAGPDTGPMKARIFCA